MLSVWLSVSALPSVVPDPCPRAFCRPHPLSPCLLAGSPHPRLQVVALPCPGTVSSMHSGRAFGELALVTPNGTRAVTVIANGGFGEASELEEKMKLEQVLGPDGWTDGGWHHG